MSKSITMRPNESANGDAGVGVLAAGGVYTVSDALASDLVNRGKAFYTSPTGSATGTWIPLDGDKVMGASDDGKCYSALAALTITLPAGLVPRPSICVMPPPTGNLSITGMVNGSQQTLTRTRASNPAGIAISAYQDGDGYGVGGV